MSQEPNHLFIFTRYLVRYTFLIRHVLSVFLLLIVLGGVAIAYLESLHVGESIYFAFITGLTIGYGDIAPVTTGGRVVSVAIAFVGLLFTGLVVAIATRALADAIKHIESMRD
jgi:hypothetical protein